MATFKHKGGRGKRAPYQTTVIRVPTELAPIFEQIQQQYLTELEAGSQVDGAVFIEQAVLRVLKDEFVTRKKKITVL